MVAPFKLPIRAPDSNKWGKTTGAAYPSRLSWIVKDLIAD